MDYIIRKLRQSEAISVLKEYRGLGIGSKLMKQILKALKEQGYKQVSLSVQKENYAADIYKKVGFRILNENKEDYIMISTLLNSNLQKLLFRASCVK